MWICQSFEAQNKLVHFNVPAFYSTLKCNICIWDKSYIIATYKSKIYVLNRVLR